jgi:hypothetical protein
MILFNMEQGLPFTLMAKIESATPFAEVVDCYQPRFQLGCYNRSNPVAILQLA